MIDVYDPRKPFNEQVRKIIRATHPTSGPITVEPRGKRFAPIRDHNYWKDFDEQPASDGIGTKGYLHWMMDTLEYGVQDAFAMVVDDLMEDGHVPVTLEDHIMLQEENQEKIFRIMNELSRLCMRYTWEIDVPPLEVDYVIESGQETTHPIIILGGETAIMNTLQGFEMGIFGTGYVRNDRRIIRGLKEGDELIGVGSTGPHSNDYTFFRGEFLEKRGMSIDNTAPWDSGTTIGEALTRPTRIYMQAIKDAIRKVAEMGVAPSDAIHGMVHITGGGMSKLTELLPETGDVDIEVRRSHSLRPGNLFGYSFDLDRDSEKMYTRFNNGVGYVIAVPSEYSGVVQDTVRKYFPTDSIGRVVPGTGRVLIESQYEDKTVVFTKN